MPAPGELKRRKKTKNPFRWIKEKILDPILKKLKPHIQDFLKTKFGSSLKKFAHWVNDSVIQQDKFGLMNAIRSVVPYGQYLEQALKIAGNLADKMDYDKVGQFIEKLVYQSDRQDKVIKDFAKYEDTTVGKAMNESEKLRERVNKEFIKPALERVKKTEAVSRETREPIRTQPRTQVPIEENEENEEEDSSLTTNQRVVRKYFGNPIN